MAKVKGKRGSPDVCIKNKEKSNEKFKVCASCLLTYYCSKYYFKKKVDISKYIKP